MKISNLYGKKIESEDKKTHGVIMAISCAKNEIDGYICFDQDEKEFFVSAAGTKILRDKVTFKRLGKRQKGAFNLRLGLPVFHEHGKFVGTVTDCSVMGGKLAAVFCNNKRFNADTLSIGDAVIIKAQPDKKEVELAAKDMFINAMCNG